MSTFTSHARVRSGPWTGRGRTLVAAILAAVLGAAVFTTSAEAGARTPACPDTVVPNVAISPSAVGCWNAIAVQTIRLAAPYPLQGIIHTAYVQAAVYDAITKIKGRYVLYHDFAVPAGVDVRDASPEAATAAAAYTVLTSPFLAFPQSAQAGLTAKYSAYTEALGGTGSPAVQAGIIVGQAAANGLIAYRTGDRDESITFTPGPLTPGGWTFAPPPSLQTAQTPWAAVMRPFMLESPSQFRVEPPPSLNSPQWAQEYNEIKAYGALDSTVRTPAQTAIANFWGAFALNQSNQAFQDVAITHGMDLVDTARLLAMGNAVDSDAGIACWDSKYHYLFWRPIMAIRNAQIDGNPATRPDPTWTPLLVTPNHPEYPAAHTCLTGAEAEMYAIVLGTRHINITIHGSTDGTPNNWTAIQTFNTVNELDRNVVNARVWAGLHYRGSALEGLELGRQVTQWALHRYLRPALNHPSSTAQR